MSEPWFDPNAYAWIPGTVFGSLGGLMGALAGTLASTGRAKGLVLGGWWLFIVVAVTFLVTSIVAWTSGQPYGIWYGFGLPGLMGVVLFPAMLPVILYRYREAEQRRMRAADIVGS
jgi:hypothetical protein